MTEKSITTGLVIEKNEADVKDGKFINGEYKFTTETQWTLTIRFDGCSTYNGTLSVHVPKDVYDSFTRGDKFRLVAERVESLEQEPV